MIMKEQCGFPGLWQIISIISCSEVDHAQICVRGQERWFLNFNLLEERNRLNILSCGVENESLVRGS